MPQELKIQIHITYLHHTNVQYRNQPRIKRLIERRRYICKWLLDESVTIYQELDFSGLLAWYSDKGRTGYNPIMMYAVVTYANMRGVRAVDRIVELCERDLAFIWLTKGQKPRRDAFYDFKGKKLTGMFWMNWITSLWNAWKKKACSRWKSFSLTGRKSKRTQTGIRLSGAEHSITIWQDCWIP